MADSDGIRKLIDLTFDVGMQIHKDVGPGLIESVYERVLADRMVQLGVKVNRQQPVHVEIYGKKYEDAFRYDLLLNDILLVEIKSLEKMGPVHRKQVLTYIRLMNLPFGLLLNFGCAVFSDGMQRISNDRYQSQNNTAPPLPSLLHKNPDG
jgi:iron complex transport system substrate-binding protein